MLRRWGHQQCTEPGRRDRQSLEAARKRNRTDETKTAGPAEDPTVDIIVPERSACWQGGCVENKDSVWMGRDTQAYKYCAGEQQHRLSHRPGSQWLHLGSGILAWRSPSSSPGTVGPSRIDCPTSRWQNRSSTGRSSGPSPGLLHGCVLPTCAGSTGLRTATVR